MADISIELCDFARLKRLAYQLLGIQNPNDADDVVPGSPFSKDQIADALLQADYNIRILIAKTPAHTYRTAIDWAVSRSRANGEAIPFYIGAHGTISITFEGVEEVGRVAQHFDQILHHQKEPELYGYEPYLYWIENSKIYFGHPQSTGTVELPNVQINRVGGGSLKSPVFYEWGVLADAMKMFYIDGSDPDNLKFYTGLMQTYEAEIKGGSFNLTAPEIFQRLAG